jgi:hypothetical protein
MARPTRAERNIVKNERTKKHRVKRVTEGKWNFAKAVIEIKKRGFVHHRDAEAHWNSQTIIPCWRKMLMRDNRAISLRNIMGGNTFSRKRTSAEKAESNAKCAATHRERGSEQQNWKETAAWVKGIDKLDPEGLFEVMPVPDGLGTDVLVRIKGAQLWAPVQVKSATVHKDETSNYGIHKKDGDAKYKNMMILAVGMALAKDCKAESVDHVPDVSIEELFLFNRANDFPDTTLRPIPRTKANDKYGDSRYVFDFDSNERIVTMQKKFHQYVHQNSKWTQEQVWFGTELNMDIEKQHHYQEILNLQTLAHEVGITNLRAPLRQHETTDVIMLIDDKEVNISVKTAKIDSNGFQFDLKKHPNDHLCNIVLAFYKNAYGTRTHVSVLSSKRVYVQSRKSFNSSATNNKDVLANRIGLLADDTTVNIFEKIRKIMN